MTHALIHTQGVVLGKKYVTLELAYQDVMGIRAHFHIRSPLNYSAMRKFYPNARPDVVVITEGGTSYAEVIHFLKLRFRRLSNELGPYVIFGYKGESYQPQVLRDAGIPHIMNVEKFGVPALKVTDKACYLHKRNESKCALVALDQILRL